MTNRGGLSVSSERSVMTTARVVSGVLVYCIIGVLLIVASDYGSRWGR